MRTPRRIDLSRRNLMKAAAAVLVDRWGRIPGRALGFQNPAAPPRPGPKIIVVACGGLRRLETFSPAGVANIPHLYQDLLSQGVFFPRVHNEGVTSHFNTISSILTGTWQRIDDWGKTAPENPTIFEYLRKGRSLPQSDTWFVSSNKALTSRIGASSDREYGSAYGANVVFPKQMLINAVVTAASHGRAAHSADRVSMQGEIEAMLEADNYEGLGWSVSGDSSTPDPFTQAAVFSAVEDLVHSNAPVTGDEFTFLIAQQIMRRFAPSLLVITFSDVEVAHFGSYSLHVAGIRTLDRLVGELWNEVQKSASYRDRTSLFVVPEFGRDLDGSPTNGFFNHRQDHDSTRLTWMMYLGNGAKPGGVVERPVRHIDLCPTIASLLGLRLTKVQGNVIPEIRT